MKFAGKLKGISLPDFTLPEKKMLSLDYWSPCSVRKATIRSTRDCTSTGVSVSHVRSVVPLVQMSIIAFRAVLVENTRSSKYSIGLPDLVSPLPK